MNRRGFALIVVLWLLAMLSAVVGVSLTVARLGAETSRNRVLLTRGGWAREACLDILLARYAADQSVRSLEPVDLGGGTWCRADVADPAARLDVNHATPEALASLLGNDTLLDALLDWRDSDDIPNRLGAEAEWYRSTARRLPRNGPLASVEELRFVRGFDSLPAERLYHVLTVDGGTRINLNSARGEVLATLPGFGSEAVAAVQARQATGQWLRDTDDLLSLLSSEARAMIASRYQEFTESATYTAPQFVASIEGGVQPSPLVSRARVTLMPVAGRLAVVRRMTE